MPNCFSGTVVCVQQPRPSHGVPVAGMAAGAVVGAVFAGPVGALVGAGIGAAVSGNRRSLGPQVPLHQTLNVVSVRIPADGMQWHGGTMYYSVDIVSSSGGVTWRVCRRYNDFDNLRAYMRQCGPRCSRHVVDSHFPGKTLFRPSDEQLVQRRQQLELWLQRVVFNGHGHWAAAVRGFLESNRQQLVVITQPAYSAASAPVPNVAQYQASAAPTAPAPVATPMVLPPAVAPASASSQVPSSQECQLLQIEIPVGVSAGQAIAVNAPDGRQCIVTIPEGVEGGSTLKLSYDAAAGTLSIVSDKASAATSSQDEGQILSIQVPPGILPGQTLGATVPDGRQFPVVVPANVQAGAVLHLRFDPLKGQLTFVDSAMNSA